MMLHFARRRGPLNSPRGWLPSPAWLITTIGSLAVACTSPSPSPQSPHQRAELPALDWVHHSGASGEFYMPEIMGSGLALVDLDDDGDLDLYLVQGGGVAPDSTRKDGLFINQLVDSGRLIWQSAATPSLSGFGMGVAAGDVNGDGSIDLLVTSLGPNALLLNDGSGGLAIHHDPALNADDDWSVGAAFIDFDRDSWLDLYIANYLDFSIATHQVCPTPSGVSDYCGPVAYRPVGDQLFRNRGDGSFEDVTSVTGVGATTGSGLGVSVLDAEDDGQLDLFVANDKMPNFLWRNLGDGRFEESAAVLGVAVDAFGLSQAGMGVSVADFDGDRDEDIVVSHFRDEMTTLYRNEGSFFDDRSRASGIGVPSRPSTGFGIAWLDWNLDGWIDLLEVRGAVHIPLGGSPTEGAQYGERDQLWLGRPDGTLVPAELPISAQDPPLVSRGLAVGDIDNDGDIDAISSNIDDRPRVFLNRLDPTPEAWTGLDVRTKAGAPALGVLVTWENQGSVVRRRIAPNGSYASVSDSRIVRACPCESPFWIDDGMGRIHGPIAPKPGAYQRVTTPW